MICTPKPRVVGEPVRVLSIRVSPMVTYSNGDQTQYIAIDFLFRWVSGEPHPADGENTEAAFFPVGEFPPLSRQHADAMRVLLADRPECGFGDISAM